MAVTRKDTGTGYVVATFLSNSGEIQLNSSNATVAANTAGETVVAMTITEAYWSCSNGTYFTVKRGANTVFNYALSGFHDYQAQGLKIDNVGGNPTSNVVVTKVGSGDCSLVLKLHKRSS